MRMLCVAAVSSVVDRGVRSGDLILTVNGESVVGKVSTA
jgi:hypothetical protein